jgi:Mn2+/Fe2+ NRAMP family transporter
VRPWYRPVFHLPPQHGTGRRRRCRRRCCMRWLEITYLSILRASISWVASRRPHRAMWCHCEQLYLVMAIIATPTMILYLLSSRCNDSTVSDRCWRPRCCGLIISLVLLHLLHPVALLCVGCAAYTHPHARARADTHTHTHAHAHAGIAEHNENTARGGVVCCIVASLRLCAVALLHVCACRRPTTKTR